MSLWMRPCACGLTISANPDDPTIGVRAHQAMPRHAAYRARHYPFPKPLPGDPTADSVCVDVSAVVSVRPVARRRLAGWRVA